MEGQRGTIQARGLLLGRRRRSSRGGRSRRSYFDSSTTTAASTTVATAIASTMASAVAAVAAAVATMATVAATVATVTATVATTVAAMTAMAATIASAAVAAAIATVATVTGLRLLLTARQGESDDREKHRDPKHNKTIHPRSSSNRYTLRKAQHCCRRGSSPPTATALSGGNQPKVSPTPPLRRFRLGSPCVVNLCRLRKLEAATTVPWLN